MADFQSSLRADQIETVLTGAIVPTRGKALTELEKLNAREYIGASAYGEGIKIVSHFDTLNELKEAVPKPKAGEAYSVGTELPNRMYAFDFYHNEWHDYGPIRSDDITARLAQNILVSPDAWQEDDTLFVNYTYKAAIPIGEITGNDFPVVVFNPDDAAGGNFCPVAFAFDGYVEIWATAIPEAGVIIPAVTFIVMGETGSEVMTKGITNATGALPAGVISTTLLANGAVTEPKISNGAVTRAKLARDALYSPISHPDCTSNGDYNITADDIGKTLLAAADDSDYNPVDVTITLPIEVVRLMPPGTEIAVVRYTEKNVYIQAGDGVRFLVLGMGETLPNAKLAITDPYGMVALKRVHQARSVWLVTGNVEVVE